HPAGARVRARRGVYTAIGEGSADRHDHPDQPLRPRRQGPAERAGGAAMSPSTPLGAGPSTTLGAGRLSQTFARIRSSGAPGLVTYITAGDPDVPRTEGILAALDRAGGDVLEVVVPFSDPLADGPVIQRATERALASGTTLTTVLDLVGRVRSSVQ